MKIEMKTMMVRIGATAALGLMTTIAFAQDSALEPVRLAPADMDWGDGDAVARFDIGGDNETPGMYAYRVRFPEGFRNEPHFHPDDRIVTIISGTLHMGYGERFDQADLRALPPGSVWTEPENQPHFVWAQDGEVVIQVIGMGPSGTTEVEE